jgi:hypothetical protein
MSSTLRSIAASQRTGGSYISISASGEHYTGFTAPTSASTGFVNNAGNKYNFTSGANAATAIAAAFTGDTSMTVGNLYRDLNERYEFVAQGEVVAIFATVQLLNQVEYEGSEAQLYICIWSAASAVSSPDTAVAVARI